MKDKKKNGKSYFQKKKPQGAKAIRDQKLQNSEEEQSDEQAGLSEEDSDAEVPGQFYIKFKESVPPIVKKDMMIEDLWILMKRPMVTN